MRPTEATERLIRRTAWPVVLAVSTLLGACSNGASVDFQTFDVSLTATPQTVVNGDGTAVSTIDMVVNTDVGYVVGANLKYAVSAGDLSSTTAVSGSNGLATVTWTLTPAQIAAQPDPTFAACAASDLPASCTPVVLATLHLGTGP
jgi:hypothetical protein